MGHQWIQLKRAKLFYFYNPKKKEIDNNICYFVSNIKQVMLTVHFNTYFTLTDLPQWQYLVIMSVEKSIFSHSHFKGAGEDQMKWEQCS